MKISDNENCDQTNVIIYNSGSDYNQILQAEVLLISKKSVICFVNTVSNAWTNLQSCSIIIDISTCWTTVNFTNPFELDLTQSLIFRIKYFDLVYHLMLRYAVITRYMMLYSYLGSKIVPGEDLSSFGIFAFSSRAIEVQNFYHVSFFDQSNMKIFACYFLMFLPFHFPPFFRFFFSSFGSRVLRETLPKTTAAKLACFLNQI